MDLYPCSIRMIPQDAVLRPGVHSSLWSFIFIIAPKVIREETSEIWHCLQRICFFHTRKKHETMNLNVK